MVWGEVVEATALGDVFAGGGDDLHEAAGVSDRVGGRFEEALLANDGGK